MGIEGSIEQADQASEQGSLRPRVRRLADQLNQEALSPRSHGGRGPCRGGSVPPLWSWRVTCGLPQGAVAADPPMMVVGLAGCLSQLSCRVIRAPSAHSFSSIFSYPRSI